jgi:molybdenum cofactor cytidylyltransferase
MSASLCEGLAGLSALTPVDGAMILPADMPDLTTNDLRLVAEAFRADPSRIVQGTSADGVPGHPAVFPADLWVEVMALTGDQGGRSVIARHAMRFRPVALPGDHAITDLDTPEAFAAWRGGA